MTVVAVKARRGDLAVLEVESRDGGRISTWYDVAKVTSVTRDGLVKTILDAWGTIAPVERRVGLRAVHVLSAQRIDVDAALRAAAEHHWPGHPDQPMPFDTLDDVRNTLRPFKKEPCCDASSDR